MLGSIDIMRAEGNLPSTVEDVRLQPHMDKAVIELRRLLTSDIYNELEARAADDEERRVCGIAEANLAMSYAVTSLNVETHGSGIVRSKGFDESRSELLSQKEVEQLRTYYKNIAMELLEPFIPQFTSGEGTPDTLRRPTFKLMSL